MSSNGMWNEGEVIDESAEMVPEQRATGMNIGRAPEDNSTLAMLVHAAQGIVRDPARMAVEARKIGAMLAGDGFYRFPVGGQTVEGASIDLAESLAQVWGGIIYKVGIINVESLASGGRRIHLRSTVTDLKSLVAAEVDAVVATTAPPGKFSKNIEQSERWHAMSSQAASSKIVRNCILRVLPTWFVESGRLAALDADAKNATGGKSLPEARANAVKVLEEKGLTTDELIAITGQPVSLWAVPQLAMLGDLNRELKAGRVSLEQVRANLTAPSATPQTNGRNALGITPKKADATVETPAT